MAAHAGLRLLPVEGLDALNGRLGTPFDDPAPLAAALAHRSWCAENPGHESNERLEFLGDAVLGLVVTDHIYRAFPGLPEGELAKVRASVVSAAALSEVAVELELGGALLLGKGEDASGGREKPSILADALEAVLGAVYLEGGWDSASKLVLDLLGERISEASAGPGGQDYKTRLQELVARHFPELPRYAVRDEGPDHAKRFFAQVKVGGIVRGRGDGRSKKQAEAAAARDAWRHLRAELEPAEPDHARATEPPGGGAATGGLRGRGTQEHVPAEPEHARATEPPGGGATTGGLRGRGTQDNDA